ncbi:MAG: gluconate 2-dehydrogenase subunit 3 family protein, partial [Ignavibacteria bacterium]|nr:gluconate 2-dehydrogenase subunit 3 family protein [Ignavibacteria bacterium]
MNRRDSLKAIAIGSLGAGSVLGSINSTSGETVLQDPGILYGRTPAEKAHDAKLKAEKFFTEDETASLVILCNIIIPADNHSGSASDAEVPEFIEFMMKDQPHMQVPVRGGLKWLDIKSFKLFNKSFVNADKQQRVQLISLIAYPGTAAQED